MQVAASGEGKSDGVEVKVIVTKTDTKEKTYLDTFEFEKGLGVLKDEMTRLRTAIDHNRDYQLSEFAGVFTELLFAEALTASLVPQTLFIVKLHCFGAHLRHA